MTSQLALETLKQKRDQLQSEVADRQGQVDELSRLIINIESQIDAANQPTESHGWPPVIPNQYRGLKLPDALIAYMSPRQSKGFIPLTRIASDLNRGGADLTKNPARFSTHLKILIKNAKRMYEYDEEKEAVKLIAAQSAPLKRKRAAG